MAGTLTISTLSDGTNSTSATNCIQGSAKAWVNFNGTGTVAIRASYNVSSITDNGTGNYTVNFTNAFSDTNYSAIGNCTLSNAIGAGSTDRGFSPLDYATTSVRFVVTDGGSGIDPLYANVSIFR